MTTPTREDAEQAIRTVLAFLGENPRRDGLVRTPYRVVKAFLEMTGGYDKSGVEVLSTLFDEGSDELVIVRKIPFVSLCEHHMLPFTGFVDFGYLPAEKVVGLSKVARLVDMYARRLQIQERMTSQIAETFRDVVKPRGVAVVVRGEHSCMSCRGVNKSAEMVTSSMLGVMRESSKLREEFLSLIRV